GAPARAGLARPVLSRRSAARRGDRAAEARERHYRRGAVEPRGRALHHPLRIRAGSRRESRRDLRAGRDVTDFWSSCGFNLLRRGEDGRLVVTDDYLRLYYLRPELAPIPESCAAERRLHAALMEEPRREVAAAEIEAIADPDARENYAVLLRFRARLL